MTTFGLFRIRILVAIENNEDVDVTGLRHLLDMRKRDTALDVTLKRLVRDGLVDRYGTPYRYYITEKGRAYLSVLRETLTPRPSSPEG